MGISETIQDLIGKYSVTGVLRERLELAADRAAFEARQFGTERTGLLSKIADLEGQVVELTRQLSDLTTTNCILESQLKQVRSQLEALQKFTPATELDMGAEITLGALMNNPSGVTAGRIASTFSGHPLSVNDVMVWIDEFRERDIVQLARADMGEGCEYRLILDSPLSVASS